MITTETLFFARVRRGLESYYQTVFVRSAAEARKLKRKLMKRKTRPLHRVELVKLTITRLEEKI